MTLLIKAIVWEDPGALVTMAGRGVAGEGSKGGCQMGWLLLVARQFQFGPGHIIKRWVGAALPQAKEDNGRGSRGCGFGGATFLSQHGVSCLLPGSEVVLFSTASRGWGILA